MAMTSRTMFYVIVTWVIFVFANSGNELINETLASPELNEYGGHVCSVLRLFAFVVFACYIFVSRLQIRRYSQADLLFIGIVWFGLSVASDIIHRHYFKHSSWEMTLLEYNIFQGRIRAFVLLAELFGPYLFGTRIRLKIKKSRQSAAIKAG
jgi:hypothetical protein